MGKKSNHSHEDRAVRTLQPNKTTGLSVRGTDIIPFRSDEEKWV